MTANETAPKLRMTRNYDLFTLHPENRPTGGESRLRASMERHGYLPAYPLHCRTVGGGLQIVDGHTRFETARALGLPVFYVVAEDNAHIHDLAGTQRQWGLADYVISGVRAGDEELKKVMNYQKRTGLALTVCVSLLAGSLANGGEINQRVKTRTYKTREPNLLAENVAYIVTTLAGLKVKCAKKAAFVNALSRALAVEQFDPVRFLRQSEQWASVLPATGTRDEYTAAIEAVYNKGRAAADRVPVAFLADNAARLRNPIGRKG